MYDSELVPFERPEVYERLKTTLADPLASFEEIYRRISVLPAFACHLLRVANSSEFSGRTPIDRLDRAAILLEREVIRDLADDLVNLDRGEVSGLDRNALVHHHVVAAEAAAITAQAARLPLVHEARAAGLLHDLGIQLQLQARPDDFMEALKSSCQTESRLVDNEPLFGGTDHCQLAEDLMERWGFPESLVQAIGFHHDPLSAPQRHKYLATIIAAGECLAARAGYADIGGESVANLEGRILDELRLSHDDLEAHVPLLRQRIAVLMRRTMSVD